MYTIVRAVVDACCLPGTQLTISSENAFDLEYERPVINICGPLFSALQPIVYEGTIGGIVLETLVRDGCLVRLSERPPQLPQWAELDQLRNKIGIAVFSIVGENRSPNCRRNLTVSIPFLEREMGCLRKTKRGGGDTPFEITFTP